MYFSITTFGCKVNQYESSNIIEYMSQNGHILTKIDSLADFHIVNSCTVTENSDRKVKSLISRIKRSNPNIKVILCGCFPKAFPEKAAEIGADIVVEDILKDLKNFDLLQLSAINYRLSTQTERTRAFLKIQDGCDRNCSYCIIPKARGAVKSRTVSDVVEEAAYLAQFHKEIVITGINLFLYEHGLVNIIEKICEIDGISRLRLSSLEPDMLTESDIIRISKQNKLCEHFHLSLQSGSDSVLKRMNRRYNTDFYRKTAAKIREYFPTASLTTDIIAGFPGETDAEFAETLAFSREIGFAKIHAFAYSKRSGTVAAEMPHQVPEAVKRQRVSQILELAEVMRAEFFAGLIGTNQEVLIEKSGGGFLNGHTPCYTPVVIESIAEGEKNDIVKVKITEAKKDHCVGIIV